MAGFLASQVRRAFADDGLADDDGGLALGHARHLDGGADLTDVLPVNAQHIPAIGGEALANVLGMCQSGGTLDGDAVVIVEQDEIVEFQVASQGACLVGGALHDAAVTADDIDLLVEQAVAGADAGLELLQANRHANG